MKRRRTLPGNLQRTGHQGVWYPVKRGSFLARTEWAESQSCGNLSLLNLLWDGIELSIGRKTSESFVLRGAKLTMGLQIQSATLRNFFERSGDLARGTVFLPVFCLHGLNLPKVFARFQTLQRLGRPLALSTRELSTLLAIPVNIDDNGFLTTRMIDLAPEAKDLWVQFHDKIERQLRKGENYYDIRDVASKAADNAARMATLFQRV